MQGAGDRFLAGAGIAGDQDIDVGVGDLTERLSQMDHDRTVAEEAGLGRRRVGVQLAQSPVFQHQLPLLRGAA